MKKLICDIQLGGSTRQWVDYNERSLSDESLVANFKKAISYRAKTKPFKVAKRVGCLFGIIQGMSEGIKKERLLDCLIQAINELGA